MSSGLFAITALAGVFLVPLTAMGVGAISTVLNLMAQVPMPSVANMAYHGLVSGLTFGGAAGVGFVIVMTIGRCLYLGWNQSKFR